MAALPAPALELIEVQHGVVARFQLLRWLSPDVVDSLVQRGTLIRLERGVYRVRGGAVIDQQVPFAAALRARPEATLTGPAVLAHLGVDGFATDGAFEVLVRPGRTLYDVSFPWREDPRPERVVTTGGEVRLALPGDALVHSVRWRQEIGDRQLRLGCDWMGWRGLLDREAFVADLRRRAGVDPLAAELLEVLGGDLLSRCESEGERALGPIVRCFDPPPEPQVWVTRRRLDWYFAPLRLGLEYDGGIDHDTPAGRAADTTRDAELEEAGVRLLRVQPHELADVTALLVRVATAVTLRAAELSVPAPAFDPSRRTHAA